MGFPLVVKPVTGSLGYHSVYNINSAAELETAIKIARQFRPDFMVEQHVSGDNFRALAQKDTLIGKKVKDLINAGALMPRWLASALWIANISAGLKGNEKIIMDGAPRRPGEGELLDEVLAFVNRAQSVAILIDISPEESMKRLLSRGRSDDTEDRIKNRLSWYDGEVKIVLDYYKKDGRLLQVNGEQSKEAVFSEMEIKLEEHFK